MPVCWLNVRGYLQKVPVKDGAKTRHKLEPEPEDSRSAQIVRRIFSMSSHNMGCKEIAKALNHEGLRTAKGERWGKVTIHKILTNEAYCGILVWAGRPTSRDKKRGASRSCGKRLACHDRQGCVPFHPAKNVG